MRKTYSIRLFEYDHTSGGIKVMYELYAGLLLKGEVVLANAVFQDTEKVVGIYPEISHGNELMAKTVVRYILNKPGVMASNGIPGPTTFAPTDQLFTFSKLFMDLPNERVMFLPVINTEIFKYKSGERPNTAVFYGKGASTGVHPDDSIEITRSFAVDQQMLADLLNSCHTLYSYDPVSAMTEIARLCGCKVIYCSHEYTRSDYEKYEPGLNGMTFPDDNDVSELDPEAFERHYKGLGEKFYDESLPNFIKITQEA
jgi:O-antigen biosynthesis protein